VHFSNARKWPAKAAARVFIVALSVLGFGGSAQAADPDRAVDPRGHDAVQTATPIKHVIIIVGENRSFDHLFATYVPRNKTQTVLNLLSEGIINADGSPGPNFARAHQYKIVSAPNGGKYFSSADLAHKELYATLPAPDVAGVSAVSPLAGFLSIPGGDPGLPAADQAPAPFLAAL
jgi:phospholipase C